jgi:hypothetical protein
MLTVLATAVLLSAQPLDEQPLATDVPQASQEHGVRLSTGFGRSAGALIGSAIGVVVTGALGGVVFVGGWLVMTGTQLSLEHGFLEAIIASCVTDVLGALLLVPLGAWLGHKVAGGQGNYAAALAGSGAGITVGAALITGAALLIDKHQGGSGALLLAAIGATTFIAGPLIGLELSHQASVPRVGLGPIAHGGGMVSLAWEI